METENKIILFWLVTRANLARLSNGDLLCRSSQSPKRHGSEASPVIDRVVGEREKREGRISKPGNRDKNVFPFSALFSPPLSHSIARAQSLLFSFVFFFSLFLARPSAAESDRRSTEIVCSFTALFSSLDRAVILMQPAFLSCIDSTLRRLATARSLPPTLSSSYGTHDSLSLSFLELSSSPSPSLHKSIRIDYYPGLHTPGDLARLPSGRFKLGLAPVVVVSELLALFPFLFISYRLGHIKRRENSQQQIPTFT